jgi:hypothetical protein
VFSLNFVNSQQTTPHSARKIKHFFKLTYTKGVTTLYSTSVSVIEPKNKNKNNIVDSCTINREKKDL